MYSGWVKRFVGSHLTPGLCSKPLWVVSSFTPCSSPPNWPCHPPPVVSSCSSINVLRPISFLSQQSEQKSLNVPKTVAARTLLVPNPLPAGMAERRVTSIPHPKSSSCSRSDWYLCNEYSGKNPHSARAAFGIENGEPTWWKSRSSSYVVIFYAEPRSMLLSTMCGSRHGLT